MADEGHSHSIIVELELVKVGIKLPTVTQASRDLRFVLGLARDMIQVGHSGPDIPRLPVSDAYEIVEIIESTVCAVMPRSPLNSAVEVTSWGRI